MGILKHFDLNNYKTDCFLETGTENGHGIDHALKYNFKEINSIEINESFYRAACIKYVKDTNVVLWHGNSTSVIPNVLEKIKNYSSCFFWLDAHLPSDPGSKYTFNRVDDKIEFPLESEINLIVNKRDIRKDIFLIDDLRIYVAGPFQHTADSWPYKKNYPNFFPHKDGIKFLEILFSETHDIKKIYDHEGYVLITPK